MILFFAGRSVRPDLHPHYTLPITHIIEEKGNILWISCLVSWIGGSDAGWTDLFIFDCVVFEKVEVLTPYNLSVAPGHLRCGQGDFQEVPKEFIKRGSKWLQESPKTFWNVRDCLKYPRDHLKYPETHWDTLKPPEAPWHATVTSRWNLRISPWNPMEFLKTAISRSPCNACNAPEILWNSPGTFRDSLKHP